MSQVSQAQSTGQSDVAKSYELQIRKNKAQLIQLDEMLRQERNTVIAGSLRVQKDCLLEEIANLETNIKTLHRVSANAKKYKAQITLPDYRQAPQGYRRQGELESKNVLRVVHPPFNPDLHPKQRLKYVWDKLLHYGRDHYFSEADYLSTLGMVLSGEPFEIYNRCIRANYNLLQTIEELTTFYESGSTMNDIKREHNSFQRLAGEAITKTMYRYRALVEKMKDEFTPEAWPEVREVKLIAMLTFAPAALMVEVAVRQNCEALGMFGTLFVVAIATPGAIPSVSTKNAKVVFRPAPVALLERPDTRNWMVEPARRKLAGSVATLT